MAVLAGSIFSLLVGFFTGYFCGRRCHKDEDDNLPYPDTEYEYFEQRQNVNRWVLLLMSFVLSLINILAVVQCLSR